MVPIVKLVKAAPMTLGFDLTICGIDELTDHCDASVTHLISILDPDFAAPDPLQTVAPPHRLDLRFHDVVVETPGKPGPDPALVADILAFGRASAWGLAGDQRLLVHCHAGISRSTAAALLLMAQAVPDRAAADLMGFIAARRVKAWPNLQMIEYGDDLLGRGGHLVDAVRRQHAAQLRRLPHLGPLMAGLGRERELAGLLG